MSHCRTGGICVTCNGNTCTLLEGAEDADWWDSRTWLKMTDKKRSGSPTLLLMLTKDCCLTQQFTSRILIISSFSGMFGKCRVQTPSQVVPGGHKLQPQAGLSPSTFWNKAPDQAWREHGSAHRSLGNQPGCSRSQ